MQLGRGVHIIIWSDDGKANSDLTTKTCSLLAKNATINSFVDIYIQVR